jgi:ribonuclease HI
MILGWCDGSCDPNPGQGGWGWLFEHEGRIIEGLGSEPDTTNNRMEMRAAIELLKAVPDGARVTVHSDSRYTVKLFQGAWKGKKNLDLVFEVRTVIRTRRLSVTFRWVPGHRNHPRQERADVLANTGRLMTGIATTNPLGGCPKCGNADETYTFDLCRWATCSRHRVRWLIGDAETLQEIVYETVPVAVHRYRHVDPIYPKAEHEQVS